VAGARSGAASIRPEDEASIAPSPSGLRPEDLRLRFFSIRRELPRSELARLVQVDYSREMALIALGRGAGGAQETLGVVRAVADPDNDEAEFAIIVDSALKGRGLGQLLLAKMIRYLRDRGTQRLVADVLRENRACANSPAATVSSSTQRVRTARTSTMSSSCSLAALCRGPEGCTITASRLRTGGLGSGRLDPRQAVGEARDRHSLLPVSMSPPRSMKMLPAVDDRDFTKRMPAPVVAESIARLADERPFDLLMRGSHDRGELEAGARPTANEGRGPELHARPSGTRSATA
jgi:GNAT superfamily N-acetyltransferase